MKNCKFFFIIYGCLIIFICSCRGNKPEASQGDSTISQSADSAITPKLTVYDEDNTSHSLTIDDSTLYCVVASWCPYSKKFVQMLSNSTYNPITKKYKVILIFEKEEIPKLEQNFKENPSAFGVDSTNADDMAAMTKRFEDAKKNGYLFSPEFLSLIPRSVPHYYSDQATFNHSVNSYPKAYDSSISEFNSTPLYWYKNHVGETELLVTMANDYSSAEK